MSVEAVRTGAMPERLADLEAKIARAVQRHSVPLGYSIDELAGHSLRRGMATTAKRSPPGPGTQRSAVYGCGRRAVAEPGVDRRG